MPELPEVEITLRGIAPELLGRCVSAVCVRAPELRYPIPPDLPQLLVNRTLLGAVRRAKYLLLDFGNGRLLLHLGMSGSLRLLDAGAPAEKHDHLDIEFGKRLLRLRDPRRFGAALWLPAGQEHALLDVLGPEPLDEAFTGDWLHAATRGKTAAIKPTLMDSHLVVGIGNIYASESLFRAGIDPRTPAGKISRLRYQRLVAEIRATLRDSIARGGSSLRDFIHSDGSSGYFQQDYFVYDREGESCRRCGTLIKRLVQGQRATFYCSTCQR